MNTFIHNGRPDPDTKSEIKAALIDGAADAFNESLDPETAIALNAFYDPIAEYLESQQQDLADVLDASQIDHADGAALDLLAALIGVSRNIAEPATGTAQFSRSSATPRDYTIPKSTKIQTDESNPISFETTEADTLHLYDDFEDNDITEYQGDTGSFTTQNSTVYDGSYALQGNSSSSSGSSTSARSGSTGGTSVSGYIRAAPGSGRR